MTECKHCEMGYLRSSDGGWAPCPVCRGSGELPGGGGKREMSGCGREHVRCAADEVERLRARAEKAEAERKAWRALALAGKEEE